MKLHADAPNSVSQFWFFQPLKPLWDVQYLDESAITILFKLLLDPSKPASTSDYEIWRPSHVNDIASIVRDLTVQSCTKSVSWNKKLKKKWSSFSRKHDCKLTFCYVNTLRNSLSKHLSKWGKSDGLKNMVESWNWFPISNNVVFSVNLRIMFSFKLHKIFYFS